MKKIKKKFHSIDPDIEILGLKKENELKSIPNLDSKRGIVDPEGIWKSDMVFVPLEDGDRTEALLENGKKVVTVDLNPLSRTGRKANITVVDNIVRCIPKLTKRIENMDQERAKKIVSNYDNQDILSKVLSYMSERLQELAEGRLKEEFEE